MAIQLPETLESRMPEGICVEAYDGVIEMAGHRNFQVDGGSHSVQIEKFALLKSSTIPELVWEGSAMLPMGPFNGDRVTLFFFNNYGKQYQPFAVYSHTRRNWSWVQNERAGQLFFRTLKSRFLDNQNMYVGCPAMVLVFALLLPGMACFFIAWPLGVLLVACSFSLMGFLIWVNKSQPRRNRANIGLIRDIVYWLRREYSKGQTEESSRL